MHYARNPVRPAPAVAPSVRSGCNFPDDYYGDQLCAPTEQESSAMEGATTSQSLLLRYPLYTAVMLAALVASLRWAQLLYAA